MERLGLANRLIAAVAVATSLACATTFSGADRDDGSQARAQPVPNEARTTVPVEFDDGLPIIEVEIDGVEGPVRLLLDTGAPTILRPHIASLAMSGVDPTQGHSTLSDRYGNLVGGQSILLRGLSIGQVRMESVPAVVIESEVFSRFCPPIDGILGTGGYSGFPGALERAFWRLDVPASQLHVSLDWDRVPDFDMVVPARTWLLGSRIEKLSGPVLVPVRIEDRVAWAVLDTGGAGLSTMSVGFFEGLVRSREDLERYEYLGSHSVTIADRSPSTGSWIVYPAGIDLGGVKLSSVPFRVVEMNWSDSVPVTLQAELLTIFDIVVDLRRHEVRLGLRPDTEGSGQLRTQLRFDRVDDRIVVVGMLKEGHAARAGIRLGDELVRLRGEEVNVTDRASVCAATRWDAGDDGEVEMTLQRGGDPYTVTLPVFEGDLRRAGNEP